MIDTTSMKQKLQEYKKNIKEFVEQNKSGVEDVHKLRVSSREIYSLMSHKNPFYKKIKKVIKRSNKVRDLDVFFEEYLKSLPKKYTDKLDIDSIKESANKKREENIDKLHIYLKYLAVPNDLKFRYDEKKLDDFKIDELKHNQKKLHKYRIYIKKRLVKEKNSSPQDTKIIKLLTKIKDLLGTINDNNNGIKSLETYNIETTLFQKIYDFTQKQNARLFKEFIITNEKYIDFKSKENIK